MNKTLAIFAIVGPLTIASAMGCSSPTDTDEKKSSSHSALIDGVQVDDPTYCENHYLPSFPDLYEECQGQVNAGGGSSISPTEAAFQRLAPLTPFLDWEWSGGGTLGIDLFTLDGVKFAHMSGPYLGIIRSINYDVVTNGLVATGGEFGGLAASMGIPWVGEIIMAGAVLYLTYQTAEALHQMWIESRSERGRPNSGLPTGTKGIDRMNWPHDRIEEIKKALDQKPNDWTGVSPDEHVWTGNPDGSAEDHGRWDWIVER